MTTRVHAHRRANKPVRGHARHFAQAKTFRGKVAMLLRAKPDMPEKMARGIVGKWVKAHES
jgi:hypothetical protein